MPLNLLMVKNKITVPIPLAHFFPARFFHKYKSLPQDPVFSEQKETTSSSKHELRRTKTSGDE